MRPECDGRVAQDEIEAPLGRVLHRLAELRDHDATRSPDHLTNDADHLLVGADEQHRRRDGTGARFDDTDRFACRERRNARASRLAMVGVELEQPRRLGDDRRRRSMEHEHACAVVVGEHPKERVVRRRQGLHCPVELDRKVDVRRRSRAGVNRVDGPDADERLQDECDLSFARRHRAPS